MTDNSNELNELMLKSIIDKLNSFTKKLDGISNDKTEQTPDCDIDDYINKLHGLFDDRFSQLLKLIGSIKTPPVKVSNNKELKDGMDTILRKIDRDSDVASFIKKRLFIITTVLMALIGLLVFLNLHTHSNVKDYELNALKYKALKYLGSDAMVNDSRVIDAYFIQTPIDSIKSNIKEQEHIEKQRINDYRKAKKKETEAKRLIEEANILKN